MNPKFLAERFPARQFADHPSPGKYLARPVVMIPPVEEGFHKFHALPNNGVAYIATIGRSVIPPELLPARACFEAVC